MNGFEPVAAAAGEPASLTLLLAAVIYFLIGYLLGSVPFGLIFTRAAGLGDIRAIGSKNIGATNVLRTGRKDIAIATLLADMLKGTAAVVLAGYAAKNPGFAVLSSEAAMMIAGFGAFLGHLYPVWLRFKGGKGVATYIGVLLGISLPAALVFGAIWLLCAFLFRYSSLSALIASAATPAILFFVVGPVMALFFAVLSAILIAKHHENIRRLLAGTEAKIGSSKARG